MDWHHPDGARCATNEDARKRFVEYTHGLIRELLTNYGKVDVLWYDVSWPLDARGWESERMNKMVIELQPDIIVNNRNALPGDFSTPEQKIVADQPGRAWESCMTLNESWGYHQADDAWKTPKTIVRNLVYCAHDAGNYLLNIGPKPDGSIPEESVRILTEVGRWTSRNAESIHTPDRCQPHRSNYAGFTRKGNTLYMHIYFWPGETVSLSGLKTGVKSARLLASGQQVKFQQDRFRVRFTVCRTKRRIIRSPLSPSSASPSRCKTPISCAANARAIQCDSSAFNFKSSILGKGANHNAHYRRQGHHL
jgi:alpha-L-fucosidase